MPGRVVGRCRPGVDLSSQAPAQASFVARLFQGGEAGSAASAQAGAAVSRPQVISLYAKSPRTASQPVSTTRIAPSSTRARAARAGAVTGATYGAVTGIADAAIVAS